MHQKSTSIIKARAPKRPTDLIRLAERGFTLYQQIALLSEELEEIKNRLKLEAESRPNEHIALADKESEGSQWVLVGESCECRVIFPEDRVNSEFDPTKPEFASLISLAGDHFSSLFRKVVLYRVADKKTFRERVQHLFDNQHALELLDLSTSPCPPKMLWKARPTMPVNS